METIESAEHALTLLKVYDLYLDLWKRENGPDNRGLARQIAVVALVTRRQLGLSAHDALPLSVLAFRKSVDVTPGAFRKSHSHARALLDYGTVGGVPIWQLVSQIDVNHEQLLPKVDALVQKMNLPAALAARAALLGGARGGRPVTNGRAHVLEGVMGLLAKVARGDAGASVELDAISELIGQRTA
ncbi:hypothetical protein BH10PSE5_BH10PSE5_36470 [soil metagenome]